jgi:hypothetical protein
MLPCNFSLSRQLNTSCPEYNIQSTSYEEITADNCKYNQYNLVSIHSIKALLYAIHTLLASPWPPCSRWSPYIAKPIKPSNIYHNSHTFTIPLFELWTTLKPINLTFNLSAQQCNLIKTKMDDEKLRNQQRKKKHKNVRHVLAHKRE